MVAKKQSVKAEPKPRKGDLIEVHWVDIAGSEGDPNEACCPEFITPGYFLGYRKVGKHRALVCEKSRSGGGFLRGWDAYPTQIVMKIEVIRRGNAR